MVRTPSAVSTSTGGTGMASILLDGRAEL
jgi:hypothetical protein